MYDLQIEIIFRILEIFYRILKYWHYYETMKILCVLFFIFANCFCQSLTNIPGVPQSLIRQANTALKESVPELQRFSLGQYCRYRLYRVVKNAVQKLQNIHDILEQNNVVFGNNNAINGDGNVVIGNQNDINGDDNWLLSIDKFHKKVDRTLVFRNWEIKMDQIDKIFANPNLAIITLNEVQKNQFRSYFGYQHYHNRQTNLFSYPRGRRYQYNNNNYQDRIFRNSYNRDNSENRSGRNRDYGPSRYRR